VTASDTSPNRTWRPSLLGVALTAIGMALFIRLGFWQLDRAERNRRCSINRPPVSSS